MAALRASLVAAGMILVSLYCVAVQWVILRVAPSRWRGMPLHFFRMLCRVAGIRVDLRGEFDRSGPLLIVANHLSWIDIPVIGSLSPLSFIAKKEVEGWPVFGWMSRLQHTVFIDRNRKRGAYETNRELAGRLQAGDAIVLFAEGTSGDGNRILPFKSAVVGAAEAALRDSHLEDMNVQPMAIAYTGVHGVPIDRQTRARYAWYGDMDLLPHLWGVLKRGPVDAVVSLGPVHKLSEFGNRKELTRALEAEVRRMFAGAVYGSAPALRETQPVNGQADDGRDGVKGDSAAPYRSAGA